MERVEVLFCLLCRTRAMFTSQSGVRSPHACRTRQSGVRSPRGGLDLDAYS